MAAYEAEVAAAELAAKRQRVAAAEADWLQVGAWRAWGAGDCNAGSTTGMQPEQP